MTTNANTRAMAIRAPSGATGSRTHGRLRERSDSRTTHPPLPRVPPDDGPEGLPADVESEYRLNIARELRRAGYFLQRSDGALPEGFVSLLISSRAGLSVPVVSLDRSSGHPELDASAMAGLGAALARVQLPDAVTGVRFKISFVLDYGPSR